jgi:hypothetical protein
MLPRPTELKETWGEWWGGWKLWFQQVGMNAWYGRGGLNVKVGDFDCFVNNFVEVVQLPKSFRASIDCRAYCAPFYYRKRLSEGNLHESCRLEDVDRLPVPPK